MSYPFPDNLRVPARDLVHFLRTFNFEVCGDTDTRPRWIPYSMPQSQVLTCVAYRRTVPGTLPWLDDAEPEDNLEEFLAGLGADDILIVPDYTRDHHAGDWYFVSNGDKSWIYCCYTSRGFAVLP